MCHLCVLDLELLPSRLRIAAVLRGSCMGRAGVRRQPARGTRQPSRTLCGCRPGRHCPASPGSDFTPIAGGTQAPGCCHKAPQIWRPRQQKRYGLSLLEANSPKSRGRQGWSLLRVVGGPLFCVGAELLVLCRPSPVCLDLSDPWPPIPTSHGPFPLLVP